MRAGVALCAAIIGAAGLMAAGAAQAQAARKLVVATSVAPITDIVRHVGGDAVIVVGLIPEGRDSHTYEPAPADAKALGAADAIVLNGLHLETPIAKLAEKVRKNAAPIIELGDATITKAEWQFDFSFPKEKGNPNPHLWLNVAFAGRYAEIARDR